MFPLVSASFPPPYTFVAFEFILTFVFTVFPPALFPPKTFVTVPDVIFTFEVETVPDEFEPP